MQWQDIRTHYPQQWLLVEALAAHSENNQRILESLAVLDTYADSATALRGYADLHGKSPDRELYVLHTSRETPDIAERRLDRYSGRVMTPLRVDSGLLFVTVSLFYGGRELVLPNVVLDTGSAGTIFPTDRVAAIGLNYEPADRLRQIRGVGGSELVFTKWVDKVILGDLQADDFEIEVGAMDYGFPLDGIIGTDFLLRAGAVIDLRRLEVGPTP